MAVYFLHLKTFGRSGGSSAVSAAAYRAGERIRDERTGRTYDHTERRDVMHKEILVPSDLAKADMGWAKDRSHLWNSAESAEVRKNARVAREYLVALPVELDPAQRLTLVRTFSQELTDRYRFALDLAVHAPRDFPGSDPRNFHAHLLATTREVNFQGFAAKTTLELNDSKRRELGLPPGIDELLFVRERWATVTNEALRDAHVEARVDHRSLAAQGIDREPYPYVPRAAYEMERHGYRSALAERMRMEYQARVQARLERESARELPAARECTATPSVAHANKPPTLEEIRRRAREDWLRLRHESANQAAAEAAVVHGPDHDDHLSR
ncbi:MAG: MobQ family relaxase [Steroidobacteraceae bacterium]